MVRVALKSFALVTILFAASIFSHSQNNPSAGVQQALAWLPPDTQTVIAADLERGPAVTVNQLFRAKQNDTNPQLATKELWEQFTGLPLRLFQTKGGAVADMFTGQRIVWALEGSRQFRAPSGLGEMPFEGCEIAMFANDISSGRRKFLSSAKSFGMATEQIEGQAVSSYPEKKEDDTWTIYVAFPRPKMVLLATNRDYLQQVLARMKQPGATSALPSSLPEWKYVNTGNPFWAVRHFDKGQSSGDPTSPFGGKRLANVQDDQAVGVTFNFDPSKGSTATVTFLSGDPAISQKLKAFIPSGEEEGPKEWNVSFRDLAAGVAEASFQLPRQEGVSRFILFLQALLGHATYW